MSTALHMRKKDFKRRFGGFSIEEVTAFLDVVADAFERLAREKGELEERTRILQGGVNPYDEAILWDALNTAQKATEKLHKDAQREAELILHEARILGEAEIEEARRKALQIRKDMVDLRSYKELFIAHLKALSRSQMEILDFDQKDKELPLIRIEEPYQDSVPTISPFTQEGTCPVI